jgi:hypothetical protein
MNPSLIFSHLLCIPAKAALTINKNESGVDLNPTESSAIHSVYLPRLYEWLWKLSLPPRLMPGLPDRREEVRQHGAIPQPDLRMGLHTGGEREERGISMDAEGLFIAGGACRGKVGNPVLA